MKEIVSTGQCMKSSATKQLINVSADNEVGLGAGNSLPISYTSCQEKLVYRLALVT